MIMGDWLKLKHAQAALRSLKTPRQSIHYTYRQDEWSWMIHKNTTFVCIFPQSLLLNTIHCQEHRDGIWHFLLMKFALVYITKQVKYGISMNGVIFTTLRIAFAFHLFLFYFTMCILESENEILSVTEWPYSLTKSTIY